MREKMTSWWDEVELKYTTFRDFMFGNAFVFIGLSFGSFWFDIDGVHFGSS